MPEQAGGAQKVRLSRKTLEDAIMEEFVSRQQRWPETVWRGFHGRILRGIAHVAAGVAWRHLHEVGLLPDTFEGDDQFPETLNA